MKSTDGHYVDYPVFKGLQRPLEFLIFQGRYIYWAAATAGGSILGFIVAYWCAGFVVALIVLAVSLTVGSALIMLKQRKGLHSKKEAHGVFVYAYSKRL